jgi:metal-responsive CopG/Arc/MetJ family transcriptional regulator
MVFSTYIINMKPVQMLIDDELLADLDADEEVRQSGRSKVMRRLIAGYLESRREAQLDAQYRQGYGDPLRVAEELEGWAEEGTWPEE